MSRPLFPDSAPSLLAGETNMWFVLMCDGVPVVSRAKFLPQEQQQNRRGLYKLLIRVTHRMDANM